MQTSILTLGNSAQSLQMAKAGRFVGGGGEVARLTILDSTICWSLLGLFIALNAVEASS